MRGAYRNVWLLLLAGLASVLVSDCGFLVGQTHEQRVLSILQSGSQARKRKALLSLKVPETPAVRRGVESVLATDLDPHARAFAAQALGRLGAREAIAELRKSARHDSHWLVRSRAMGAIVDILGSAAAEDLRFSLDNDEEATVKVEAVRMAARALGRKQAAQLVVAALKDRDPQVRLAAHTTLKEITGQDFSPNDYDRWHEYVNGQ